MSYANSNNTSKTSNNSINITQDNKISSGRQNNNVYPDSDICNALDCFEKATLCIKVNAGKFGDVSLRVCNSCVSKFKTTIFS